MSGRTDGHFEDLAQLKLRTKGDTKTFTLTYQEMGITTVKKLETKKLVQVDQNKESESTRMIQRCIKIYSGERRI